MITSINSVNSQSKSNPTFERLSIEVKHLVRKPQIKSRLMQAGIDNKVLDVLDKSPIRISLLKNLFEPLEDAEIARGVAELPDTAGLIVKPPRGSHLPNLCVTADDKNIFEAGIDSFLFSFQKVIDLVDSYKVGKINLNNHNRPLKERKIEDLHGLDNAINLRLRAVVDTYNYGGGQKAIKTLVTDINHINKIAFQKTNKYDVECARNKKAAMTEVRNEWLDINARRLEASA